MNRSLIAATLLAVALSACSKKEEAHAALPAPATTPALPTANLGTPTEAAKSGEGIALPPATEPKPAAEEKALSELAVDTPATGGFIEA